MKKVIKFKNDARKEILIGAEVLTNAIASTLGPSGKNVLIRRNSGNHATKDGVTVANEIELTNPFQDSGAAMIKEASQLTAKQAGDSTSTTAVLALAIIKEAEKFVKKGYNPILINKAIERAEKEIIKEIQESTIKINIEDKELDNIACISANNDKNLGKIISEAVRISGVNGVVVVEESKGYNTSIKNISGYRYDAGFASPMMINDLENQRIVYENCYVLLLDSKVTEPKDLIPAMDLAVQKDKPLIIVAQEFKPEVLVFLLNNIHRGFKIAASIAPEFYKTRRAMMKDIAILGNGTCFTEELPEKPDKDIRIDHLCSFDKVIITEDDTTLIGGQSYPEKVQERLDLIKRMLNTTMSEFDKEKLRMRFSKLSCKSCIVYVGGVSEIEVKQKRDRVDDAIAASIAAVEEGIVPGGGTLLKKISDKKLGKFKLFRKSNAEDILYKAIQKPFYQILENAGINKNVSKKLNDNVWNGINVLTGEINVNLKLEGIIDPAKSIRIAIQNACSVAKIFITTDTVIVNYNEIDPQQ